MDEKYLNQPKFKAYCEEVLNALEQFDRAKEWADLIQCLRGVSKVISKYSQFPLIPFKLTTSKRLAQCLNPALPNGVHLKTLETYQQIFQRIETQGLAADLAIYSTGLFPFFQFASTQLKPKVLELYENYYLPLKQELYPSLPGLVLSLLPGLEEETSEFYPKVLALLDALSLAVDMRQFYFSLWKALLQSPHARLPALNYLLTRLPKQKSDKELEFLMPERNKLVQRAIEKALLDSNVLVQRSALELLNLHFPLHIKIFEKGELSKLIEAALLVLTRREMSLNRRLYSWFLGDNEDNVEYFPNHGRDVTVTALKALFENEERQKEAVTTAIHTTVPYKVLMSLLDKEEIGSAIIDDVLIYVLQHLHAHRDSPSSHDIIKTAILLFDQLQLYMFWSYLTSLITDEFSRVTNNSSLESVELIDCVMDILPLKDSEVQTVHLPALLSVLIQGLEYVMEQNNYRELYRAIMLALKLIGKLHTSVLLNPSSAFPCRRSSEHFYESLVEAHILPFCYKKDNTLSAEASNILIKIFDKSSQLLITLHTHQLFDTKSEERSRISFLDEWFECVVKCCSVENPLISCLAIRTFISFLNPQSTAVASIRHYVLKSTDYCQTIAKKLWSLFEQSLAIVHYPAAELFLDLSTTCEDVCSEIIAESMIQNDLHKRIEGYQRFALIWRLTGELGLEYRPFSNILFLMLDSLNDENPTIKLVGKTWLGDSITKAERILDPLLLVLLDPSTRRQNFEYQKVYDTRRVLHVWRILKVIIECDFKLFMQHVMEKTVSKDILKLNDSQVLPNTEKVDNNTATKSTSTQVPGNDFLFIPINNYLDLLVVTALRFIQGRVSNTLASDKYDFSAQNAVVQTASAEFLQYLILKITDPRKAAEIASKIQEPVLQNLAESVSSANLVLQVQLLSLLRAIVLLDSYSVNQSSSLINSQMFLQTLIPGLLQSTTKNVRFYWLEFITSCLPYLRANLSALMTPIVKCICDIIKDGSEHTLYDSISAKETLTLLKSLHILLHYCITESNKRSEEETVSSVNSSGSTITAPMRFISDLMTNVFKEESQQQSTVQSEIKKSLIKELPSILESLLKAWGTPSTNLAIASPSSSTVSTTLSSSASAKAKELNNMIIFTQDGEVHNKYAIQDQIVHIIDPIMAVFPNQLLHAMLVLWCDASIQITHDYNQQATTSMTQDVLLELLHTLESATVDLILSATTSMLGIIQQHKQKTKNTKRTLRREAAVLEFVDCYITRYISVDKLSQSWTAMLELLKQSLGSSSSSILILIRIVDNVVKKLNASDKKSKQKKDLQDIVQRLIEAASQIAGKTFSSSSTTDSSLYTWHQIEAEQPVPKKLTDTSSSLSPSSSVNSTSSEQQQPQPSDAPSSGVFNEGKETSAATSKSFYDDNSSSSFKITIRSKVLLSLSQVLVPMLDSVFEEKGDRLINILSNVLHNLIPHLKDKSPNNSSLSFGTVSMLATLCEYSYSVKAWKKDALDLFYDNDFFSVNYECLSKWKIVIDNLMSKDKASFEHMSKIISTPPTIFTNKEQDNLNKANNLKRLTFIIYSGATDQYIANLPLIQEKLVEALKIPNATPVYIQVFMCLRVALLKFSAPNLRSFWPIILTELMRVFSDASSVDTSLLLAVCKFLDLALVVPTDEFPLYDWIFIAESLASAPKTTFVPFVNRMVPSNLAPPSEQFKLKRPMITIKSFSEMKDVDTNAYLKSFLSKFYLHAQENAVSGINTDFKFVTFVLDSDFIELET